MNDRMVSQETIDEIWELIDARHETAGDTACGNRERIDQIWKNIASLEKIASDCICENRDRIAAVEKALCELDDRLNLLEDPPAGVEDSE